MLTETVTENVNMALKVYHEPIPLKTRECLQFIDLTDQFIALVGRSGVRTGFANIQTRHTTTAIVINENEPLLIQDMKRAFERLAPHDAAYHHDDFEVRTVNMCPGEEKNGHAHCKAMFLKASETVNVVDGTVQLGQWQRIFFIELDRGKERSVSVLVLGQER
jgi:secondary thiamine-phosphate synthase enzyme